MFHIRDNAVSSFTVGAVIRYLDSQAQMTTAISLLGDAETVSFDTEFLREKTYHPMLCLMQLGFDEEILLIDPLTDIDLSGFWDALLRTPLVLHSGRQDLEVLKLSAGRLPHEVIDTQIAAGLNGMPAQIGYAKLVSAICKVELDKAHTRTDWSRRPLAGDVLDYAADDVRYLPAILSELQEALDKAGRLSWLEEDCADLLAPALYENDCDTAWQRVKGLGRLPKPVQQRVVALARWREALAQQLNRPRQWILRDQPMIEIAFANPDSVRGLQPIDGVAERFAQRNGTALIEILTGPLPEPPSFSERPDEAHRERVKRMAKAVREVAKALDIEAEILAPQRELRQAASGDDNIRALRGWREALIGDALRKEIPG